MIVRFLTKRKYFNARLTVCIILLLVLLLTKGGRIFKRKLTVKDVKVKIVGSDNMNGIQKRNSLEGASCRIPKLEQNGLEMMQFIEHTKPLDCGKDKNWVFIDENGFIRKIDERKQAKCQMAYFVRKSDLENEYFPTQDLKEGEKMSNDFASVSCTEGWSNWEGLLMSVAKNRFVEKRAKEKSRNRKSGVDRLDVVIFGFDSMSQQHFRRKMPETIKQLQKMESVILNGYNIVGDGTPQAYTPILTSKTELELPLTRKRYEEAHFVDDVYPFIWNNFSDSGYATLYTEDAFAIGTYTYRLKGFRKQPTDHYTRTVYKELEERSQYKCIGSEEGFKPWFRYGREFLREYKDVSRFVLMHQSIFSHDDINLIEVEDEHFSKFLANLEKDGDLDNAVLIVMGDHGHRFAKIRDTHQGQLEERLPMFSVRLPPKFRKTDLGKKMYANLLANKDRLTTPFDVHATLMDALSLPKDVDTMQDQSKRSLSMFRPIPENRSCDKAGVEPHWCTCLDWQDAMENELDLELTTILALKLVSAIDDQLSKVRHVCANVQLKRVISSKKLTPNDALLKYNNVKDKDGFEPVFEGETRAAFAHYQLKIETSPNDAVFEATVFFDGRKNELEVDLTSLSHVNRFGDDPHCIIDEQYALAAYCVCHDKVRTSTP